MIQSSPLRDLGNSRGDRRPKPQVTILGAGPAGLGAAFQLTRRGLAHVTVLEQNGEVGGNAASFELAGMRLDYGSHRLHQACDPQVLGDIRALLGDDLLDRPRHGRIRLRGRWIHFPLKPLDLAFGLSPDFALGVATDLALNLLPWKRAATNGNTFGSILKAGLGETICRDFYFPYARKLWGLEPEELSAKQAQRRISANSLGKMTRKVLSAVPGLSSSGKAHFFYPRLGFGQICDALRRAVVQAGADVQFNCRVSSIETENGAVSLVNYEQDGRVRSIPADYVWSTIPLTSLVTLLNPSAPVEIIDVAGSINYRAMILIYLVVEQDRFTEYDAHYFAEPDIPISRLSEPKNYNAAKEPRGFTVLCAELPSGVDSPEWGKSDEELGRLVCDSLKTADIPVQAPVKKVVTRRLRQAYPIYRDGYEDHFDKLDRWLGRIDGLLTFGRQGLFAHDNTHHALYTGYAAAACLDRAGRFDDNRWQAFRRVFETHVVED